MLRIDDLENDAIDETAEETTETVETPVEDTDEVELGEEAAKKSKKKKADGKKKMSVGKKVGITIAVVLVVVIAALAIVGVIATQKSKLDFDKTVVTVDGVESNSAEFVQLYAYYKSMYSQYGQSVEDDDLKDDILKQLEFMDVCYARAKEQGLERSDDDEKQKQEILDSLKSAAEEETCSEDEIVERQYGKGFNKEIYINLVEKQQLANQYQQKLVDEINDKFADGKKDKEIEQSYTKEKKGYDLSNAQYCFISEDAENAEANAKAVVDAIKGGATIESAAEMNGATMGKGLVGLSFDILQQNFGADIATWVFKQDDKGNYENGKGAVTSITSNGSIYVVSVNEAPARDDTKPVTAYYGLVAIGESEVKTEAELVSAAKATAKQAYNEFNKLAADKKTPDAFANAMQDADNVTADQFSSVGYYDTIDAKIRDWLFDSARKPGDITTIETDDGIYIIYYVEADANPSWFAQIKENMIKSEQTNITSEIEESIKDKIVVDEEQVAKCIEYVNSLMASAS